ncbi:DinB family protein [Cytophaga aurantiaca]|uniref:DinB family protein n=1 Tax=Cytophaga aurantiaca TaxID=29530 RepID=UPI000361FF9E|nr:DinB family protein [Cytophaga aurantiaca]
MELIPIFLKEFEAEALTTRNMLSRIPDDKYDWQPHPKSMTIRSLATHIADLPGWVNMALTTDELDFATAPYNPPTINTTKDVLEMFEQRVVDGRSQLISDNEHKLGESWTLRDGETILFVNTKAETVRVSLSQLIHHRAQLGVFLRLLNIPIPGSYGPSADEN